MLESANQSGSGTVTVNIPQLIEVVTGGLSHVKISAAIACALTAAALSLATVTTVITEPASAQDGSYPSVATGSVDQSIRIWDNAGKQSQNFLAHDGPVNSILFTPDGKIISCSDDKSVKIWNSDGQLEITLDPPHDKAVLCLALSPNGKILASGGADKVIKLWNPLTGKLLHTIAAHNGAVKAVAWSPDSQLLASGGADRLIQVWRPDGKSAGTIIGHDEPVTALVWSKDGRVLISGGADGSIIAWNIGDFGVIARSRAHTKSVTALALNPDGKTIASAGTDLKLRIINFTGTAFMEAMAVPTDKALNCLAWSRDGRYLIAGGADKTLRYFNTKDYTAALTTKAHDASVTALAVSTK
jgi:WD40 repeat protein